MKDGRGEMSASFMAVDLNLTSFSHFPQALLFIQALVSTFVK